jgi:hypothetical protein
MAEKVAAAARMKAAAIDGAHCIDVRGARALALKTTSAGRGMTPRDASGVMAHRKVQVSFPMSFPNGFFWERLSFAF